jgi:hypothetical protein
MREMFGPSRAIRLVQGSRAEQSGASGDARPAIGLDLDAHGAAQAAAVAVSPQGKR